MRKRVQQLKINHKLMNNILCNRKILLRSIVCAFLCMATLYAKANDQVTIFSNLSSFTNFQANEEKFCASTNIDFTDEAIEVSINVSSCDAAPVKLRNILSVGNRINAWGDRGKSDCNLHFYYTPQRLIDKGCDDGHGHNIDQRLRIAYVVTDTGNSYKETSKNVAFDGETLLIKLSSEGLSINGELISDYSNSELSSLLSLSNITIGSQEGATGRSNALYNYAKVSKPTSEKENILCQGKVGNGTTFYLPSEEAKDNAIDFGKEHVLADLDLTTCTATEENVFSIGEDINVWGTAEGKANLHVYYKKDEKKLYLDLVDKSCSDKNSPDKTYNVATVSITDADLSHVIIKLSKEGISVNGGSPLLQTAINNKLTALTSVQIGSHSGWSGQSTKYSHATYNKVSIITTGEEEPTYEKDFTRWIQDETQFEDHKEAAHATYIPYASESEMKADADFYQKPWLYSQSSLVKYLNSTDANEWKFCYVKGSASAPGASRFYAKDFDDSNWGTIRVPLSWEMAGYGRPVYNNIGYSFDPSNPPVVMKSHSYNNESDNNATGFYRRNFTISDAWSDKRIFLHFDGVYSAAVVWVDGQYVGYTQGSNTDAEFDITQALQAEDGSIATGEGNDHKLSVRVYRWCDGSYLEGQDMWRLAGIHRDVYLVAKPKVYVSDPVITMTQQSEDATSGTMNVALTIDNRDNATTTKSFCVTLKDSTGKTIATQSQSYDSANDSDGKQTLNLQLTNLSSLTPWSAETPYLYHIEMVQKDAAGKEEMAWNTKYGFRKITKDSKLVYVNGKRVFFKGVNTQDTHPEYGKAIDTETLWKDLTMMKQANINTVRTSHYPRQPKMYAMMDALGFYVMDEADVECHYNWINQTDHLSNKESWSPQFVDRNVRMVKRDKNHPSVIFWSLGNESGDGICFTNAYKAVKALDTERPIHYEGSYNHGYGNGSGTELKYNSDLYSDMYPTYNDIKSKQAGYDGKPYFICEYEHAMGQSVGNLKDDWQLVENSTGIIGGCIWDWVDQAIYQTHSGSGVVTDKTDSNGFHYWTAGYDYNQAPGNYAQGNFLDNGLVTPDRRWSGKLAEVKKVYQNVGFTAFGKTSKSVTLKNKFAFTDISSDQFDIVYRVLKDGRLVEEGKATSFSTIKAGEEGSVTLPIQANPTHNASSTKEGTAESDDAEYLVNVELRNKMATDWAEAGHVIADEQFSLTNADGSISEPTLSDKATASNGSISSVSNNKVIGTDKEGKVYQITFAEDGKMTSWTYGGKDILYDGEDILQANAVNAGPDFNSMRDIDNDVTGNTGAIAKASSSTSTEIASGKALTLGSDGNATMSVNGTATNCNYTIDYTFYPDATVDMKVTLNPSGATRRLGLGMQFAQGFENVEFYARGPWSNYSDRKSGCYLGRYTTTVDDMVEELVHPQTYGDHEDLRELVLTNHEAGMQLDVKVEGHVSFSLSHYDESVWCDEGTQMWQKNTHWYSTNMAKKPQVFAHFDYWQRGLGNNSCQGDVCLEQYRCPTSGCYTYTLRFKPSATMGNGLTE